MKNKMLFRIELHSKNNLPLTIALVDTITIGSNPRCDAVLNDKEISDVHLEFKILGENIALSYQGKTGATKLNNLPLEQGRTYILDLADHLQFSRYDVYLSAEEIAREKLTSIPESLKNQADRLEQSSVYQIPEEFRKNKKVIDDLKKSKSENSFIKASKFENKTIIKKMAAPKKTLLPPSKQAGAQNNFSPKNYIANIISLIPLKIYAIISDITLTYFILTFVLSYFNLTRFSEPVLFEINHFLFQEKATSLTQFFIAWYGLNLFQTLIFGKTISQFLLGLKSTSTNSIFKFLLYKIKTLFYALILIPPQEEKRNGVLFYFYRYIGFPILLVCSLISPFFLNHKLLENFETIQSRVSQKRETNVREIDSYSNEFKVHLETKIDKRFYLFSYFFKGINSFGLNFYDFTSNQNIEMIKTSTLDYQVFMHLYRYVYPFKIQEINFANPLEVKNITKKALSFDFKKPYLQLSEIDSNVFFLPYIKNVILSELKDGPYTIMEPNENSPILVLTSGVQKDRVKKVFLFGPTNIQIFEYQTNYPQTLAVEFESTILKNIVHSKNNTDSSNQIAPFEIFDALLKSDEMVPLTYYINTVNTLLNENGDDPTRQERVKKVLMTQIENIQMVIKNPNVKESFNNLKGKLTPMEIPGE